MPALAAALAGFARRLVDASLGGFRQRAAQRTPPAARRAWRRQLAELDPYEVEARLRSLEATGATETGRAPVVDAGITFGPNRYPTTEFVERWLGNGTDRSAGLHVLQVSAVVMTACAGVTALMLATI